MRELLTTIFRFDLTDSVRERWGTGKLRCRSGHTWFANSYVGGHATVLRRYPILCGRVSFPDKHTSPADQEVGHRHVSNGSKGDASWAMLTIEVKYPLWNNRDEK